MSAQKKIQTKRYSQIARSNPAMISHRFILGFIILFNFTFFCEQQKWCDECAELKNSIIRFDCLSLIGK